MQTTTYWANTAAEIQTNKPANIGRQKHNTFGGEKYEALNNH